MKTIYSTITLRYVHDVVTGEFANIGIVLYAPEQRYLGARFSLSCERLQAMLNRIDEAHHLDVLKHLQSSFAKLAAKLQTAQTMFPSGSLFEGVRQVLPADDSSLQWSEMSGGFTDDPEKTLGHLYDRLVERYALPTKNPVPI